MGQPQKNLPKQKNEKKVIYSSEDEDIEPSLALPSTSSSKGQPQKNLPKRKKVIYSSEDDDIEPSLALPSTSASNAEIQHSYCRPLSSVQEEALVDSPGTKLIVDSALLRLIQEQKAIFGLAINIFIQGKFAETQALFMCGERMLCASSHGISAQEEIQVRHLLMCGISERWLIDWRLLVLEKEGTLNCTSIDEMRKALKLRGNLFLDKVVNCTQKIVKYGHPFIYEGSNILVHSYSPVVLETFLFVKKLGKRFSHGIQCSLILDAAIGHFIEKVDMVMVGADGVVENGGIINKIGTYPLALCAKAFNKPLYVLAESYKFIRHYPLNQADIPQPIRGSDKRIRRKSGTVDESTGVVDSLAA
uniref:EIF-2B GDP-GTP exchange factor subunit alpha n=1 Tax=Tetranychus urticae TaxID=32264 RepID=T1L061_TETUR